MQLKDKDEQSGYMLSKKTDTQKHQEGQQNAGS